MGGTTSNRAVQATAIKKAKRKRPAKETAKQHGGDMTGWDKTSYIVDLK